MTKDNRSARRLAFESVERARLLLEYDGGDIGGWDYGDIGYHGGGGGGGGYGGHTEKLYTAFIAPFGRVARAFKYAAEDILNSLNLVFRTLTTLSPAKLREARKKFEARKNAIGAEWKPIVDNALKVIATSDLGVIAFGLYPQYYLGALFTKGGVDAAVGLLDALSASGWLSSDWKSQSRTPRSSSSSTSSAAASAGAASAPSLKSRLNSLFGIPDDSNESRAYHGAQSIKAMLFEADEDEMTKEQFLEILNDPKFKAKLDELRKESEQAVSDTVNELINDVLAPALKNYKEVKGSIEKLKNAKSISDIDAPLSVLKSNAQGKDKEFDKLAEDVKKSIMIRSMEDAALGEEINKKKRDGEKLTGDDLAAAIKAAREESNAVFETLGRMSSANDSDIERSLKDHLVGIINSKIAPTPQGNDVSKFVEDQISRAENSGGGTQ